MAAELCRELLASVKTQADSGYTLHTFYKWAVGTAITFDVLLIVFTATSEVECWPDNCTPSCDFAGGDCSGATCDPKEQRLVALAPLLASAALLIEFFAFKFYGSLTSTAVGLWSELFTASGELTPAARHPANDSDNRLKLDRGGEEPCRARWTVYWCGLIATVCLSVAVSVVAAILCSNFGLTFNFSSDVDVNVPALEVFSGCSFEIETNCTVYCRSSMEENSLTAWMWAVAALPLLLAAVRTLAYLRRLRMSWFRLYVEDVAGVSGNTDNYIGAAQTERLVSTLCFGKQKLDSVLVEALWKLTMNEIVDILPKRGRAIEDLFDVRGTDLMQKKLQPLDFERGAGDDDKAFRDALTRACELEPGMPIHEMFDGASLCRCVRENDPYTFESLRDQASGVSMSTHIQVRTVRHVCVSWCSLL